MDPTYDKEQVHNLIDRSPSWWHNRNLVILYALLACPLSTSTAGGFDISMTNSLQSIESFMDKFDNPQGAKLGFYAASMSVGGMVGCFIAPWLNDRYGRRPLISLGAIIVAAMAFMQTFATSFSMFTGGKLLLGFGGAFQTLAAPLLVTELAHPKQRVSLSSLYNTGIFIGLITGAWVSFGTYSINSQWSWKLPCILQAVLPLYQAVSIWVVPESPRWLASKGRVEEARQLLIKWHGNGVEDDIVKSELQEIVAGIEADKSLLKLNKEGIKTILGSKGNRHRLWLGFWTAVGSQCLGSNLISAYLPKVLDQVGLTTSKEKTLINGIQSIECWVIAFISTLFIIPRIRRRTLFLSTVAGMTATFIVWTALAAEYVKTDKASYGIGVVVMIFVYNIFSASCWISMVITYPLETVTTKQRGFFFAFTYFAISSSAFIISYINPVGIENMSWRYYILQVVFNLIMFFIIYFTFVETKGLTLEEIAILFDGEEAFNEASVVASAALTHKDDASVTHIEADGPREKV
jgi:sugar porter (SP) family MFS transporter